VTVALRTPRRNATRPSSAPRIGWSVWALTVAVQLLAVVRRRRGLDVAVLAAGVGVGRWRMCAGSVGLEGSGVMFDELIKPADDGELR
jgi:hypothetical protein